MIYGREALTRELINDIRHPVLAPVVRAVLDEVVGPAVLGPLPPPPHARAVVEPDARPLRLASGNFEAIAASDPFDAVHVHRPAIAPEHRGDPTLAVASVPQRQGDDGSRQSSLVLDQEGDLALGRTMLTQDTASEAFGHTVLGNDIRDTGPAASRALRFCWRCPPGPKALSLEIIFSGVRSEITRRRRRFSVFKDFSRLT